MYEWCREGGQGTRAVNERRRKSKSDGPNVKARNGVFGLFPVYLQRYYFEFPISTLYLLGFSAFLFPSLNQFPWDPSRNSHSGLFPTRLITVATLPIRIPPKKAMCSCVRSNNHRSTAWISLPYTSSTRMLLIDVAPNSTRTLEILPDLPV